MEIERIEILKKLHSNTEKILYVISLLEKSVRDNFYSYRGRPLDDFDLSVRASRAAKRAISINIYNVDPNSVDSYIDKMKHKSFSIDHLALITKKQFLCTPNLGKKTLDEIEDAMRTMPIFFKE